MYLPPTNIRPDYLEPILRVWLERNGFDLSKEYTIALVKMKIKQGVDVYRVFGPCGPFPFYTIELYDFVSKKRVEQIPLISISTKTEKFSKDEEVLEEFEHFFHVGHSYTFIPNQVQVLDEIESEEISRYRVPECCKTHEGNPLAFHY
jgi:hypothetical protein